MLLSFMADKICWHCLAMHVANKGEMIGAVMKSPDAPKIYVFAL
jgi:hypothetical protein